MGNIIKKNKIYPINHLIESNENKYIFNESDSEKSIIKNNNKLFTKVNFNKDISYEINDMK